MLVVSLFHMFKESSSVSTVSQEHILRFPTKNAVEVSQMKIDHEIQDNKHYYESNLSIRASFNLRPINFYYVSSALCTY